VGVGVGVLPRVGVGVYVGVGVLVGVGPLRVGVGVGVLVGVGPLRVGVGVGVLVGVVVPAVNLNQLKFIKYPVPLPVNLRYKLCTPVTPLTVQVLVVQVCQPPVPATVQVPTNEPVVPSSLISILPPLVAEATRAWKPVAPVPKSILL
jgi:hypothetical protein